MSFGSSNIFFPSFGLHLPGIACPLQEQNVHPLCTITSEGLDLDYSVLMAFDKLIIDEAARAHVFERSRGYLRPMRDTLLALEGEDFTRVVDFGEAAKRHEATILERADALLEDIDAWRKSAADHWRLYQPILQPLLDQYKGYCDLDQERLHFGVYCYLRRQSDRINISEGLRLNKFVSSRAKLRNNSDRELLRDLIRPLMQHAILNILLREDLESPFLDWDDLSIFYGAIGRRQIHGDRKSLGEVGVRSREAFTTAIPELRPKTVREFIEFKRVNHATKTFREELQRATRNGEKLDQRWAARVRNEATKALLTQRKNVRRLRWMLLPLKLVPIPGAHLIGEVAGELVGEAIVKAGEASAESVLHESAEHAYERPVNKFEWYYALLQAEQS